MTGINVEQHISCSQFSMVIDVHRNTTDSSNSAGDQAETIAFLSSPASYEEAIDNVQRIDTHGAIIFLAGSKAYKLKRAVRLSYLDFSTIAKRETACYNELKRNYRTAPAIYLDCMPVTREANGALSIGGNGEVMDWLVIMNRFDQAHLLDSLAAQNNLDIAVMDALANCIAHYHANAGQHLDLDGHEIVARVMTFIIPALEGAADKVGSDVVQDLPRCLVSVLNQQSTLLKSRANRGYIRLCHGDLHLRNIVLLDGRPMLFDALEFDDSLATIDILYDLAFLLMDLWHRGLKMHANRCFNEYVSLSMGAKALSGLALLPLFMSLRAAIRGMVAIDKESVASSASANDSFDEARGYLVLASKFLSTPDPVLVAVGGLSGTGKTTLAAAVAPYLGDAPGALHLRSDVERKRMFDADPLERLPRHAYSQGASHSVYRRLCDRAAHALMAGRSVIVDAVFLEPTYRHWIEQAAGRAQCKFLGLWLDADRDQLIERVTQRVNDASDATADVVRAQLMETHQASNWTQIDTRGSRQTAVTQAERALSDKLGRPFLLDQS